MSNNIGYHTRLNSNNTIKVCGGSFGGQIDSDTVARLVKSHFTVKILNSGSGVFVDREGREVNLYISVDPLKTEEGKKALAEHRKVLAANQALEDEKDKEIEELLASMTPDEVLRKLRQ